MPNFSFENKRLFVTGATSGIGLEIAKRLNAGSSNLSITGRNENILNTLDIEFRKENTNFISSHKVDLCNFYEIDALVENIGLLDGLILNAGIIDYTPAKSLNLNKIRKVFETNVFSNILFVQQLLKNKKIAKNASIVFISSIAAQVGVPGTSLYAASKGAINSYAKVLAFELSRMNIRVNVISPGVVKTDLITNQDIVSDLEFEQLRIKYPLGFGEKGDVADLVEFLISDKSRWITGSNFVIDGGYLLNN
jgi:NAD(P)-dependent dehydrogenase (short-subunit alcohol dehydrogenase family)